MKDLKELLKKRADSFDDIRQASKALEDASAVLQRMGFSGLRVASFSSETGELLVFTTSSSQSANVRLKSSGIVNTLLSTCGMRVQSVKTKIRR